MRRYKFLNQEDVFEALNRVRDAFLAARDGNEVDHIINGLLTIDEKLRIGRRVQVAERILQGMTTDEIEAELKVGRTTIVSVGKFLDEHPECYKLLNARKKKVEKDYNLKRYRTEGSSKMVFKKKVYTGYTRKDVKR